MKQRARASKADRTPDPPPEKAPAPAKAGSNGTLRATAEQMAAQQREISVSEFFAKNRHLLGFDNPTRALLTTVKEAVDNSLDACEEAGILPEVTVRIEQKAEDRFRIVVEDNGPGIVREQIPRIFGKLLYGSKFHRLKMSRGQQGIGISAAVLYSQLTTGKPTLIWSRTAPKKPAHAFQITIDTAKNEPHTVNNVEASWEVPHGTRIDLEEEARYTKGDKSVDEYVRLTALANPHVTIHYFPPGDEPPVHYERGMKDLPPEPKQIKPHPYGVELGTLIKILQSSKSRQIKACLQTEFSRVSPRIAAEICAKAGISPTARPQQVAREEAERVFKAIPQVRIMAPPGDCVVPIGEAAISRALKDRLQPQFFTAVTRPPAVYRGNPFVVEAGIAYGIEGRGPEDLADVVRLANRVPLLYQPGACAISKAVLTTDWRNYSLSQSKGAPPTAPMTVMVHIASVWVPFTSEAKEAVAHYAEIVKEIRLALQECGRRLLVHIHKRENADYEEKRRSIFERYIVEVATSLHHLANAKREEILKKLQSMSKKVTKAGGMEGME